MTDAYLAFVPHEEVAVWKWFGWRTVSDLGQHHGRWSVLMQKVK